MKKIGVVMLVMVLAVASLACAGRSGSPPSTAARVTLTVTQAAGFAPDKGLPTTAATAPSITLAPGQGSSGSENTTSLPERMIVQNGSLTVVVDDIPSALEAIAKIASAHEGYVVSSQSWKSGERVFGAISIRIPAGDFDTTMKQVAQLAVEVTSQSTSSTDVTEEYVDLAARLSSLQATEQQLLLIMSKADKVADILAVQQQLTQVQSQIEQLKGRMQYLEKTSATSLIQVNLEQAKLEVKFTADRTSAKTGEDVQFSPDVAGGFTPYSYGWDFGDGKTSTDSSPLHRYAKPGDYTVSLKVTDDRANTATQERQDYITVTQGGWSAGGVLSGAWGALLWLGRALVTLLIGLLVFSPVWIVVILVIWLVRRRRKATVR